MQRKIRVLVGKPGLDGHDRGAKVVAAALRDSGMEVIYTGLHQSPEQIVEAAVQEDVDVVALSILSGAHMTLFPDVLRLMKEHGIGDRLLTGGGIIPPEDMKVLSEQGVGKLFGPGASTQDIAEYIRSWFVQVHGAESLAPAPPPRPLADFSSPAEAVASSAARRAPRARGGKTRRTAARARGPARKPARTRSRRSAGSARKTTARRRARPRPAARKR